jgi:hypothetical protein
MAEKVRFDGKGSDVLLSRGLGMTGGVLFGGTEANIEQLANVSADTAAKARERSTRIKTSGSSLRTIVAEREIRNAAYTGINGEEKASRGKRAG